jgi:ribonucleoside-triphosphate reductase (thioredoxin)
MRIKSITELSEPEFTVDIEVANTHSYQLDNGWVSHNTVSQLVDAASGIHPRYARHYIRRVRSENKDPLTKFMIDQGVPFEVPEREGETSVTIFAFPKKAPEDAVITNDISAIDHLKLWLVYQRHWCEHKPSVTINVKEEEWMAVGAWVYDNFDELSGVSFLPFDRGTYVQAPYETISEDKYNELVAKVPTSIDWDLLVELQDNVEGSQTLACAASCEI